MSELTVCNYCTLENIKIAYKGKKIVRKYSKKGGIDIYVDEKWIVWFMELTDHCVC